MKRNYVILMMYFTPLIISSKCAMDNDYPLYLQNNSKQDVQFWTNKVGENRYPDTTLHLQPTGVIVHPNERVSVAGGGITWEEIYKATKSDTVSFFIYNADTLRKYPWKTIQEKYMILQRYDLSLQDLRGLNYTLHYPPTSAMRNMKMYPAYKEE